MKKLSILVANLLLVTSFSIANEYDPNAVLSANAGPDTTLHLRPSNRATFLDGSLSTANPSTDGIVSYEWYEGDKFIGPSATRWYNLTTNGPHTITLKVTDSTGATATDDVVVTVEGGISADAGEDITINITPSNRAVFLDGSKSVASALSEGIVKYEWFNDDTGEFIGYGATRWYVVDKKNGPIHIRLRITDTNGDVSEDTVVVTVNGVNRLVANAGEDKVLNVTPSNRAVHLDGTNSSVASGHTIVSYKWYDNDVYIGPNAQRWYVPTAGVHDIKLVIIDETGNISEDHMNLTVNMPE